MANHFLAGAHGNMWLSYLVNEDYGRSLLPGQGKELIDELLAFPKPF